ncbi:MAG: ethanolamine ammonia-lyase subunit EutC [Phenylobacterium sp.]|uniref:ethanolamine ammonia-lyase subunit EutC n=1 Tax=Phenylobacterium sp. TaxID=1871053 RepID=UPI003BB4FF52
MGKPPARDPWTHLTGLTSARIALGRAGPALPTREVLALSLAHAQARDAVHAPFEGDAVATGLRALGHVTVQVASAAPDRATYLRRPDLGRKLSDAGRTALEGARPHGTDLVLVVADGLSSAAVHAHAVALVAALAPYVDRAGWRLGPVVIATQARVALGDEIGEILGASMVALLVGERPGLSSPDSLGVYLTHGPRVGRTDAERNCISNIRAEGLSYDEAAFKLAWHVAEARRLGLTGVALKDESDLVSLTAGGPAPRPLA